MRRRLVGFALSSATGAICNALAPIVALLLLPPTEYGTFSLPYLLYAFGVSLQYSIVSEAWARLRSAGDEPVPWARYSSALATLAGIVGSLALIVGLLVSGRLETAALMGVAVAFAIYQNGTRYFRMASGGLRRVIFSDAAGIAGFVVGMLALSWMPDLDRVVGSWLLGTVSAVVVLGLPRFAAGSGLISWVRGNHRTIRPLLLDSLLMDAGAIGTPFLLAGLMGARDFGIYRAVANVAMPVRLLAEPLRPVIGRMTPRRLFSAPVTGVVLVLALVLTAACYGVLVLVLPALDFQLGTLASLVPFALPTSLFVAGNLFVTIYYWFCRMNATHRRILIGRFVQTALVILLPVLGFFAGGLGGAIWGFSVSSLLAAATWAVLARLGLRDARPAVPDDDPETPSDPTPVL